MTLISNTFHIIGESHRDLVAHILYDMGTHVIGGDVGLVSYEAAVIFQVTGPFTLLTD